MKPEPRSLGVFARGVAMGIVEVIPGVSGGTIAFITGIYERLLAALASWSPRALWAFVRGGDRSVHDLGFLLVLALGMVLGYLATARVIGHLLDAHGLLVWSFFFGLIGGSAWHLGRRLGPRHAASFGVAGLLAGAFVATLDRRGRDAKPPAVLSRRRPRDGRVDAAGRLRRVRAVAARPVSTLRGRGQRPAARHSGGGGRRHGYGTAVVREGRDVVAASFPAGRPRHAYGADGRVRCSAFGRGARTVPCCRRMHTGLATGSDPMVLGAVLAALAGLGCTALIVRLGEKGGG